MKILHKEIQRKLTFPLWKKIFEAAVKLHENPFFEDWFKAKYAQLSEHQKTDEFNPDYKWIRITGVLSIIRHNFGRIKLPIPGHWKKFPYPHTAETFDLSDLDESQFSWHRAHGWCDLFDQFEEGKINWSKEGDTNEPWWIRKGLLDEFISLYFDEIKKLLGEKGVRRNKALRDLVIEAAFYRQSFSLYNAFYGKVEPFVAGIKDDKTDPMVQFVKESLPAIFNYDDDKIDRKSIVLDMLEPCWEKAKTGKNPAETIDRIADEVRELVDFLTLDMS